MLKPLAHTIFAEGEVTGHAHRASGGVLFEDADIRDEDGPMRVFENETDAILTHEEHHAHTIPPSPTGRYRVGGVIEADPFGEAARRVVD